MTVCLRGVPPAAQHSTPEQVTSETVTVNIIQKIKLLFDPTGPDVKDHERLKHLQDDRAACRRLSVQNQQQEAPAAQKHSQPTENRLTADFNMFGRDVEKFSSV